MISCGFGARQLEFNELSASGSEILLTRLFFYGLNFKRIGLCYYILVFSFHMKKNNGLRFSFYVRCILVT